jgi:hypothetical protein
MSSPKADLSTKNEETFNHTQLVPQFYVPIPCYRADVATRLSIAAGNSIPFFGWVGHLDNAYFDQLSVPSWTLEEDGGDPPRDPNAWRNPLAQITLRVPTEPASDPQRGPTSARHKPWTAGGGTPTHFDWVSLDSSLQWQAFQRLIVLLRARGNDVLVVLGPFNEHMVAPDQGPTFHNLRDGILARLTASGIVTVVPNTLPSDLYADASHPLTDGYALLAQRIYSDPAFKQWLNKK